MSFDGKQTVHVLNLTVMVTLYIPHPSLLVNVIANKLEGSSIFYPPLNRCFVPLADVLDQLKNSTVAE